MAENQLMFGGSTVFAQKYTNAVKADKKKVCIVPIKRRMFENTKAYEKF